MKPLCALETRLLEEPQSCVVTLRASPGRDRPSRSTPGLKPETWATTHGPTKTHRSEFKLLRLTIPFVEGKLIQNRWVCN